MIQDTPFLTVMPAISGNFIETASSDSFNKGFDTRPACGSQFFLEHSDILFISHSALRLRGAIPPKNSNNF